MHPNCRPSRADLPRRHPATTSIVARIAAALWSLWNVSLPRNYTCALPHQTRRPLELQIVVHHRSKAWHQRYVSFDDRRRMPDAAKKGTKTTGKSLANQTISATSSVPRPQIRCLTTLPTPLISIEIPYKAASAANASSFLHGAVSKATGPEFSAFPDLFAGSLPIQH